MKILKTFKNYLCYCGIEKEEYNAVKKGAYISNFNVWRILHCLMTVVFAGLYIDSLFTPLLVQNTPFYLGALIYSALMTFVFFVIHKESIIAQLLIYLSISILFLFGAFITASSPEIPATTFIVFLLIIPMFMIDKPYFMGIMLTAASALFLIWMYYVKPYDIWEMDLVNIIVFSVLGFVIHMISNSIRIKEFVLTRKINIQKDIDDLTGLKNKGALTREINNFLADNSRDKGILFILDIDSFKSINDTYGHDVGDDVISQLGGFLYKYFSASEIVGRFGGDEFVFFVKDTDDIKVAIDTAREIAAGIPEYITLPDSEQKITASIGVAIYSGIEKNYSEIFKKADVALYKVKSTRDNKYKIYEE